MRVTLAAAALLLLTAAPAFPAADPARYMPAELVAETLAPKPGSTILIGFRMTPKPGWHGYWSNPGDTGIAPSVEWSVPQGVSFGPLLHPVPTLIRDREISSFVHNGPHVLLARMTIARSIAPGTPIPIEAKLSWAACTASQCVPLHGTFTLDLTAGDGAASANSGALHAAEAKLPAKAAAGAFTRDGHTVHLRVPSTIGLSARSTRFFPNDNDAFATSAGRPSLDHGAIVLAGPSRAPFTSISGVITDGSKSYQMTFDRKPAVVAERQTQAAAVTAPATASRARVESKERSSAATTAQALKSTGSRRGSGWMMIILVVIVAGAIIGLLRRRRAQVEPD